MTDTTTFKHLVGRSTLTQGVAVRRDFEDWFDAPAKGEAREIRLLFGSNEVSATLRRLDNETGSVQVRYQSKKQRGFREWLASAFIEPSLAELGRVLEFTKVDSDVYRVSAITGRGLDKLHLTLGPSLYHNNADSLPEADASCSDIGDIIDSIGFRRERGQAYYN